MSFEARKRYLIEALAVCYSTFNYGNGSCTRQLDLQMSEITETLIALGAYEAEAKAAISKALTRKTP